MSKKSVKWLVLLAVIVLGAVACSTTPDAEIVAKYTEQTALAIIEAGWKISGSILTVALFVHTDKMYTDEEIDASLDRKLSK